MKKRSFLFQIWRSFLLFVLIPVLVLNVAIFLLIYNIKETTKETTVNRMNQASFFLEQTIDNIHSSVQKMGNNPQILKLAEMPAISIPKDFGYIYKANRAKLECDSGSLNTYSISLLFNKNDVLLDTQFICSDLNKFYGNVYRYYFDEVDELKNGIADVATRFYPYEQYLINDAVTPGILYQIRATKYANKDNGVTALVIIHEENLENILDAFSLMGGMAYLMDYQGNILYCTDNEDIEPVSFSLGNVDENDVNLPKEIFGKKNFALHKRAFNDLQIVAVFPEKALFLKTNNLTLFVFILDSTTFIMCLILSGMMARRDNREISGAMEILPEGSQDNCTNPFSFLRASIGSLVDDNTDLKHRLYMQQIFFCEEFWEKSLGSEILSDGEIVSLGQSAGIEMNANYYFLALIATRHGIDTESFDWSIHQRDREDAVSELNKSSCDFGRCYVHPLGLEQIAVLYCTDDMQEYEERISEHLHSSESLFNKKLTPICVCSQAFKEPNEIAGAFTACRMLLNTMAYFPVVPTEILWCTDMVHSAENTIHFSDELKNQILCGIRSGQVKLVKQCFKKIVDDNFINECVSLEMRKLISAKFKLTLLDAYEEGMCFSLSEAFSQIDNIQTDALLISYVLRVALDMCKYCGDRIYGNGEVLRKKITDYIDEHFSEYEFSLSAVADFCNLSESYLSQLCKDILGENFSSCLERKRMNLADKLLHETKMNVDTVAEQVGYSNTNAFRKAFKKYFGISPNQHRNAKQK